MPTMEQLLPGEPAPPVTGAAWLPMGLVQPDGTTHRDAALRKLRGSDEVLFHETALSGAELVTELLRACVTRIGPVSPVPAADLDQLHSADRDYLLFALRRFTFGDAWAAVYRCPACEAAARVDEDLATFPVRVPADGEATATTTVELEDGYRDRDGVTHTRLVVRWPRGHDEHFVSRLAESDPWQARDAMLVRCIEAFGTLPRAVLEGFGVKIVRELTLGDRRRIQRALDDGAPGVDFRRTVRCPACALDYTAIADVTDFFGVS